MQFCLIKTKGSSAILITLFAEEPFFTWQIQLYKSGYYIKLIQEILGHSSVNTTKTYTHLYDKEVEKTMQEHPLAHFKMKNAMEFCAL